MPATPSGSKAAQADQTRVLTFLVTHEGTSRAYREIGISDGHHPLTHHGGKLEQLAKVTQINEYHAKSFAAWVSRIANVREGDGRLLDNMMIVYGASLNDGNRHVHSDLDPDDLVGVGARAVVERERDQRMVRDPPGDERRVREHTVNRARLDGWKRRLGPAPSRRPRGRCLRGLGRSVWRPIGPSRLPRGTRAGAGRRRDGDQDHDRDDDRQHHGEPDPAGTPGPAAGRGCAAAGPAAVGAGLERRQRHGTTLPTAAACTGAGTDGPGVSSGGPPAHVRSCGRSPGSRSAG